MSEWLSYWPEDFLLFSPRVYWRLFEMHNAALWPMQVPALASSLGMVVLVHRRPFGCERWIALIFALIWTFVGWSFLWYRYATINWAIGYVVPLFAFQAILLLIIGTIFNGLTFDQRGIVGCTGLLLAAFGLIGYPLIPQVLGRRWSGAEIFGIAPDPTVIATLGVLLLARGRLLFLLMPIPLLWLLLSGLTLQTMGDVQGWLPLLAFAAGLAAIGFKRRLGAAWAD